MLEAHLWKSLGRHPSLDFAIQGAAQALRQALPLHSLAVRWLDLEHGVLTTVAEDSVLAQPGPSPARVECSSLDRDRLLEWCRRGEPLAGRDGDPLLMEKLAGPNIPDDVLAGPLDDEHHGTPGALLLFASSGTFTAEHASTLAPLLAPFRVALATDRRFHELSRMREAFEADNRALLSRLDRQALGEDLVGADGGLAAVLRRIDQVAPTEVPVLILGETGTGKELLARAIHQRSARPSGPMVKVNCGAIPTGLVDSELFGHERGSFTGAVATRAGWFERADGGTLFLDEIGELPLEAQVRLLRVLQEGVIERVGGSRPVHVDVRLVAATHRDLTQMVASGRFREDLWYRISTFPVELPPLRHRPEDIGPLATHFAARAGRRLGGTPLTPTREDVELLLAYGWPGNVRELAAVVERAAILGSGRRLDFPGALGVGPLQSAKAPHDAFGRAPPPSGPFPSLAEAMQRHIEAALERTGGRIEGPSGAAALLDINPHTLRARMRKLGIHWSRFRAHAESEEAP
jgi:hydrogenase-4 transcriptional activator